MKGNPQIGRFDLTWDSFINVFDRNNRATRLNSYKHVAKMGNCAVIDVPNLAPYRISTQPSIWKNEYLLQFLNNDWSPWDFEVLGTQNSYSLDEKVLALADSSFVNYPTKWIHKGAVSRFHEDRINVLGLDCDTIKEMVDEGLATEDKLQWGQWNGAVPTFNELGATISTLATCHLTRHLRQIGENTSTYIKLIKP